jgi:hypothetical protein
MLLAIDPEKTDDARAMLVVAAMVPFFVGLGLGLFALALFLHADELPRLEAFPTVVRTEQAGLLLLAGGYFALCTSLLRLRLAAPFLSAPQTVRRLWLSVSRMVLWAHGVWLCMLVARAAVGWYHPSLRPTYLAVIAFLDPLFGIATSRVMARANARTAATLLLSRLTRTETPFVTMLAPLSGAGASAHLRGELELPPAQLCRVAFANLCTHTLDADCVATVVEQLFVGERARAHKQDAVDAIAASAWERRPSLLQLAALSEQAQAGRAQAGGRGALLAQLGVGARASPPGPPPERQSRLPKLSDLVLHRPSRQSAPPPRPPSTLLLNNDESQRSSAEHHAPTPPLVKACTFSLAHSSQAQAQRRSVAPVSGGSGPAHFASSEASVSSNRRPARGALDNNSSTTAPSFFFPDRARLRKEMDADERERPVVDAFVLHCWSDDLAEHKGAALERWAADFAAEHGRRPVVWLDAISSDPSLLAAERLAHTPVHMSACLRLLVLWGPHLSEQIESVMTVCAWYALGGATSSIDIAVLGRSAAEIGSVVASVDAFSCLRLEHAEHDEVVTMLLAQSLNFASVIRVNELVCNLLPRVREAAAKAEAALAAALEATQTDELRPDQAVGVKC